MMWEGDIDEYIELLRLATYIGADTENSGTTRAAELWSGEHYCTGFATAIRVPENPEGTILSAYFPFRHESENLDKSYLNILKPILETKQLGFHNNTIDIAGMETLDIHITIPPLDTTVLAHMCNEELPSKKLDWLAKFVLHMDRSKEVDRVKKWADIWGWETVPPNLMAGRSCEDAEVQLLLKEVFWKDMEP
jgi:hypothetical protein